MLRGVYRSAERSEQMNIRLHEMVLTQDEYASVVNDIYKTALEDGVRQGIAACLL